MPHDEFIARMRKERFFLHSAAKDHLRDLEYVIRTPKRARMPNRLLVGASGNGKTALIEYFMRQHPSLENRDGDAAEIPIVLIQVDKPDERQLYDEILAFVKAPTSNRISITQKYRQVLQALVTVQTKMLIVDEFHTLLVGSPNKQSQFRSVIKRLGNQLKIPIIGAGTALAYNALQADEQLSNRFYPLELPKWKDGSELRQLLKAIKSAWAVELNEDVIASEVIKQTDRTIGAIIELLERATLHALRTSGKPAVTLKALDECDYIPPQNRGRFPVG